MGDILANCDSGSEADAMANGSLNIPLRILLRCLKFDDMNIPPLSLWGKGHIWNHSSKKNHWWLKQAPNFSSRGLVYPWKDKNKAWPGLFYFFRQESNPLQILGNISCWSESYQALFAMFWSLVFSPVNRNGRSLEAHVAFSAACETRSLLLLPTSFCNQLQMPRLPFSSASSLKWPRVVNGNTYFPGVFAAYTCTSCIQASFLRRERAT